LVEVEVEIEVEVVAVNCPGQQTPSLTDDELPLFGTRQDLI
jgi:hypothetical protein